MKNWITFAYVALFCFTALGLAAIRVITAASLTLTQVLIVWVASRLDAATSCGFY